MDQTKTLKSLNMASSIYDIIVGSILTILYLLASVVSLVLAVGIGGLMNSGVELDESLEWLGVIGSIFGSLLNGIFWIAFIYCTLSALSSIVSYIIPAIVGFSANGKYKKAQTIAEKKKAIHGADVVRIVLHILLAVFAIISFIGTVVSSGGVTAILVVTTIIPLPPLVMSIISLIKAGSIPEN